MEAKAPQLNSILKWNSKFHEGDNIVKYIEKKIIFVGDCNQFYWSKNGAVYNRKQ